MLPGAPSSSSPRMDHLQTVNESLNRRLDQNTRNPQRSIAMISTVEHLHISGGNFVQNINDHNNILKHVCFQSLPCSCDAAFNAAINLDNLARRPCTNGTRVDVIGQIMAWINEKDPANAPPVYWLTGLAGLGKTTIAYTICKSLNECRLPFASFFCSLQLDSRNSKLLVTTLCRDLAELYSSYAANLLSILETNSKAINANLGVQIDELLVKPWQAFISQINDGEIPTPIVVVDALDESDRGTEFLEELLRVIHAGQLTGIKFLVTSRPDPRIVDICKSWPPSAVCKLHEVDTANVQSDIEKYLREALPELKDEPDLALLSRRAGGFFIYATTAVRFISPPHSPPSVSEMRSLLQAMLNPEPFADDDERSLVDELYERILSSAFRHARVRAARLRILHTIVCAESRIDMSVLADLTNTNRDTAKRVVESLHAVLFVSPKDDCVYWYHASFPDFVFSQSQAKIGISLCRDATHHVVDVFCNAPVHHGVLARRCFSVMQSLHFNMCNLRSSSILDSEVPGLDASIDKTFTPTLRYVTRHWARHLRLALPAKIETDDLFCCMKDFLWNKLLFWIEAMNLIGGKSECSSLLKDAESWLKKGKEWPNLQEQLSEAVNFSAIFAGSPASKSTPHLYISSLAMCNQDLPIWRKWRDRFCFIPSISLPKGAITIPFLTIHTAGHVTCIALSPDGNHIVSGSDDESVRVWDAKTGEQLRELQGHTDDVRSVAFSPDGHQIISGSFDKSVRVWNATTGEQLRELRGHTNEVWSVAFSPDGNQIVSGSYDKSVRVWDAKRGEQSRVLQGHTGAVNSVAFSPNGHRIASGSTDKAIRVWDVRTDEQLKELRGHTGWVSSVAFSPDGTRIVSGSDDKTVRVWNAKTGGQLRVLQEHTESICSVAFSPDGHRIVSGSWDRSVRVWDGNTGKQLKELQGHTSGAMSVTFSPNGNRIISGSWDGSVRVWDAKTGKKLGELPTDRAISVSFSPDGNRIVSGSNDKSGQVWDAKTDEQLRELHGHTDRVRSVVFSPDGHRIVAGSDDKSVRMWNANTGEPLKLLRGHGGSVESVAFSPDGNRIVSGSFDKAVRVWDAKTGEQFRELHGHTDCVRSVAFSPDNRRIVSGSHDKSVRMWDADTGEPLKLLRGHAGLVNSVAFSADSNRIISGSHDKSVRVWDAKTGEQLRELQGHTDWVTSVSFSPDGNRIVSGSNDKSVQVWDAKTGEQLRELHGHTDRVRSVVFSPDGHRIVSGSPDKSVRLWDANTGEQLRVLQGHTNWVNSVAFSPDGTRIVSASNDKSVRVWDHLSLDASWVVNEDGWILSGAERLLWVPSTVCNVLLRPHNTLIISQNGFATISFAQCKLGTVWDECYTS